MSILTLYHGSTSIIDKPEFGKGKVNNDYGLGFYCTRSIELAKEWACSTLNTGYVNTYLIDTFDLCILNLHSSEYGILNWLALLINNRTFTIGSPIALESKEYLTEYFLPNTNRFDVIEGYRADDSYFTFAMDFVSNTISLRQLTSAMYLGRYGMQHMIKSEKAFNMLNYTHSEIADGNVYYAKRVDRDRKAREQYLSEVRSHTRQRNDIFMLDILREEIKHGDTRIRHNISS